MESLRIRSLEERDVGPITDAFRAVGWKNKPRSRYERYLEEQRDGRRAVLVAFVEDSFAGYLTINWRPDHSPFREAGVPEIQDFNVLPRFRRRGIGTRLMDEAERTVAEISDIVGIGVGMFSDYGAAQRLYVLRGYVPDGRGLTREGHPVSEGDVVPVDNGLILYFTKVLPGGPRTGERGA
jgi:GNAT superfamily N-acetyltransferase